MATMGSLPICKKGFQIKNNATKTSRAGMVISKISFYQEAIRCICFPLVCTLFGMRHLRDKIVIIKYLK